MKKKVARTAKKSVSGKKAAARPANRREFRRRVTRNLWVTEFSGDFQFVLPAGDISEGGIFLKGRMMSSSSEPSRLRLHFGKQSFEVSAQPVYDRIGKGSYGTGYQFLELSDGQAKTLRGLLRDLD